MIENESLSVTLTLENDEELECDVLTIFETDARQYIALLPVNADEDSEDGQIYLTEGVQDRFELSGSFGNMEVHVITAD